MAQRISPKCIKGYDIICTNLGRIERNELGHEHGVPDPILTPCVQSDGLCWWLKPVGFSFSITLKVSNIKAFWQGGNIEEG